MGREQAHCSPTLFDLAHHFGQLRPFLPLGGPGLPCLGSQGANLEAKRGPRYILWIFPIGCLIVFGLCNGTPEGRLEAILGPFWGQVGAILVPSWGFMGPFRGLLGRSSGDLVAILGPPWGLGANFGPPLGHMAPNWPKMAPKIAQRWPKHDPRLPQGGPRKAQIDPRKAPSWP